MTTTNKAGRQATTTARTPAAPSWPDPAAHAADHARPPAREASAVSNGDGSGGPSPVMTPMTKARRPLLGLVDRWQRRNRLAGSSYGVVKKLGDDNANPSVVSLAWYGFTAIFPLLLIVVTVFGFIGQKSLGSGIVSTLHKFPVVGADFNPAGSSRLHGTAWAWSSAWSVSSTAPKG